jgi:methylthioribose-1-phosphate isomerase
MTISNSSIYSIEWAGDWNGTLRLLDQTQLPEHLNLLDCQSVETVWEAIVMLRVRGAPAIGIAAAYGILLSIRDLPGDNPANDSVRSAIAEAINYLSTSRPTAVNLFWALERMRRRLNAETNSLTVAELGMRLLDEARKIHDEDR